MHQPLKFAPTWACGIQFSVARLACELRVDRRKSSVLEPPFRKTRPCVVERDSFDQDILRVDKSERDALAVAYEPRTGRAERKVGDVNDREKSRVSVLVVVVRDENRNLDRRAEMIFARCKGNRTSARAAHGFYRRHYICRHVSLAVRRNVETRNRRARIPAFEEFDRPAFRAAVRWNPREKRIQPARAFDCGGINSVWRANSV